MLWFTSCRLSVVSGQQSKELNVRDLLAVLGSSKYLGVGLVPRTVSGRTTYLIASWELADMNLFPFLCFANAVGSRRVGDFACRINGSSHVPR